jgi:hypothetical protein
MVPKPKPGDVLFYLQSAKKSGAICFPSPAARSHQWIQIGMKCVNCSGFDKDGHFGSNITTLKNKYNVTIAVCKGCE